MNTFILYLIKLLLLIQINSQTYTIPLKKLN